MNLSIAAFRLKDVLERLPRATNREVDQLTPLKWKQARQSALEQAAGNSFSSRPTCHPNSLRTPEQGVST